MSISSKLDNDGKRCWICLGEEGEIDISSGLQQDWIRPCKCTGSMSYAHHTCLLKFIYEKEGPLENPVKVYNEGFSFFFVFSFSNSWTYFENF